MTRPPGTADRPALGIALMLLFATMASSADAVTKLFTQVYPVPQLLWIRFLGQTGALLLLLPWVGWRHLATTAAPGVQLARSLALLASAASFIFGLSYLPFATAKMLGFSTPLIVTALSALALGEAIGRRRWALVLLGFVGVVVIIRPGAASIQWAMLFPLGTAASYAVYQILTRRVAGVDAPLASLFFVSMTGAIATSLVGPFYWTTLAPHHAAILLVHGAVVGLGHFVMIRALTYAPASLLSPFGYASLIWAVLFGHFIFAEPLGWNVLAGGALIVVAGILIFRGATPARRVDQPEPTTGQAR